MSLTIVETLNPTFDKQRQFNRHLVIFMFALIARAIDSSGASTNGESKVSIPVLGLQEVRRATGKGNIIRFCLNFTDDV